MILSKQEFPKEDWITIQMGVKEAKKLIKDKRKVDELIRRIERVI